MRSHFAALLAAALFASAAHAESDAALLRLVRGRYAELLDAQTEIAAGRLDISETAQSHRARALHDLAPQILARDPLLWRKKLAVDALEHNVALERSSPSPHALAPKANQAQRYALTRSALGSNCGRALGLVLNSRFDVALTERGSELSSVWFRFQAPAAGEYAITTRGSRADTTLNAFRDCADAGRTPIASSDDSYGLAAELVLKASYAGETWWLKAGNDGDPGTLSATAVAARSISGRLTRKSDGSPISNMEVVLIEAQYEYFLSNTYTDAQGYYSAPVYDSGAVHAYARTRENSTEPMYVAEAYVSVPCADATAFSIATCTGSKTVIDLAAGESRVGIDFALGPGNTLAFRILSAGDQSPANRPAIDLFSSGTRLRTAFGDSLGRVRFDAVAPGTYTAKIAASGFATQMYDNVPCSAYGDCVPSAGTPITVVDGQRSDITAHLHPYTYINLNFTVQGETAPWNSYVTMRLYQPDGTWVQDYSGSGDPGHAQLGPVPTGTYKVRFATPYSYNQVYSGIDCASDCQAELAVATTITIANEGQLQSLSATFTPLPQLTGRLQDRLTGAPVTNAEVRIYRRGDGNVPAFVVPSRADGTYVASFVRPGEYLIHVVSPTYHDQMYGDVRCDSQTPLVDCPLAQSVVFAFGDGDHVADFSLDRTPSVSGRLLLVGTSVTSIYDTTVQLFDFDGHPLRGTSLSLDATTSTYHLTDVADGTYYAAAAFNGFYPQLYPAYDCPPPAYWPDFTACPLAAAQLIGVGVISSGSIEFDAGSPTGIDFDLNASGARVARVRSAANGQPLSGVALDLWDAQGRRVGTSTTGPDGRAVLQIYVPFAIALAVSTDNYLGFTDTVYGGSPCPLGTSVYRGGCDLTGATPIMLPDQTPNLPEITIVLAPEDSVFASDFE